MEEVLRVSGITHDEKVCEVSILGIPDHPGMAYSVFAKLDDHNILVDSIIQSIRRQQVNDISFTVNTEDLQETVDIMKELAEEIGAEKVVYYESVAKISVIGAGMVNKSKVARAMFQALSEENINIRMINSSEIRLSCIIDGQDIERAINSIHDKFYINGIEVTTKE